MNHKEFPSSHFENSITELTLFLLSIQTTVKPRFMTLDSILYMKLWEGGTMKNMLYGGHTFELTIFFYDTWSRNHMKDIATYKMSYLSVKLKKWPKKPFKKM